MQKISKKSKFCLSATLSAFCLFLILPVTATLLAQVSQKEYPDPQKLHALLAQAKIRRLKASREFLKLAKTAGTYGYNVRFYGLDLKIDPAIKEIQGTVEIRAEVPANASAALSHVNLDFFDNMEVLAVGGDAIGFQHANNVLQIQIPEKAPGQMFSVTVTYKGTPLEAGFSSFTFREHLNQPIISTLSEPFFARTWWPCKDVPGDKADSARIRVTVPEGLFATSNGKLISTSTDSGWTTYDWYEKYPIAAYLISLAISNYQIYQDWYVNHNGDSLSLPYYIYPEKFEEGVANLQDTPEMMKAFESFFGPYPFWGEKYGMTQFPWGGGMEHQTNTSLCCFGDLLVAHELAHQWWGDMVTCRNWQHIWLNEGFASYSEALFVEYRSGKDAYREYMNRMASSFPGRIFVDDTLNVSRIFSRIEYHKGAWVLHMLRGIVGDETFFQILKNYGNDPQLKYGTATTEDFQRIAEQVSGRDLSTFFHQWIYSSGMPRYVYSWQATKGNGYEVTLRIKQAQMDTTTFAMPIEVVVEYENGSETIRIQNTQRCQTYLFSLPQKPIKILLDPNDWILKTATKVAFGTLSEDCSIVPLTFRLMPASPNPFSLNQKQRAVTLRYSLAQAGVAKMRIYNLLGQQVITLFDQFAEPGFYSALWNARNTNGVTVPSGLYFVILESNNQVARQKLIVVR